MHPRTIWAFLDEVEKIGGVHPSNASAIAGMKAAVAKMKGAVKTAAVKQATMVKYTKPRPRPRPEDIIKRASSEIARQANQFFGLPLHPPKRKVRRYENGPSAAESADRSMFPVIGDQSPNIAGGSVFTPSYGPGGV